MKKLAAGFTLIELMIVVAVIGILAAIAMPQYNSYIITSRMAEGPQVLADARSQMEDFYAINRTYNGAAPAVGVTNFALACAAGGGGQTYVCTVTGINTLVGAVMTVNQANARATTGWPAARGSLPANCANEWCP